MSKTFEIHFRHRDNGTLEDVFERGEAKSKAAAIRAAKQLAKLRGWWFMSVRECVDVVQPNIKTLKGTNEKKTFIAIGDAPCGCAILGTGVDKQDAMNDAANNAPGKSPYAVLRVSDTLADRIEEEGSTPELAAEVYAKGK